MTTNPAICGSCPYFHAAPQATRGICRRYPPTPLVGAGNAHPTVAIGDWCGEHPGRRVSMREVVTGPSPEVVIPLPAKRAKRRAAS